MFKAQFQYTERVQIFSVQLSEQKCEFASFFNTQICSKRTLGKAQSRVFYVTHALSELFTFNIFSLVRGIATLKAMFFFVIV